MNQTSSPWAAALNESDRVAVSADGVPIHYQVHGHGPVALVFVHGWCGHLGHWDRQVDHFTPCYTVVTLDLAGHGASGTDRARYTIPAFGQDVAAVVKQLRLEQVVLVGHSMGGLIITAAAAELPTAVGGLIGVDTWWDVERNRPPAQVAQLMVPFRDDFPQAAGVLVRRMLGPTPDRTLAEQIVTGMLEVPPQVGLSALEEMLGYDLQVGLDTITAPKMAINSAQFRQTNLEAARRHGVEVVLMPGVGHFVMMEAPMAFQELLDEAVQQCLGRSAVKQFCTRGNFDGITGQSH